MPTPTTAGALKDAFRTAIDGIVPRSARGSSATWKYYAKRTDAKQGMRWYTMRLEIIRITEGGLFGQNAYTVDALLTIFADYGSVPEEELDALAGDDWLQLHDILNTVRDSIDGLRFLSPEDWDPVEGELGDEVQIAHQYNLRFLKERASNAS